MPLPTENTKPEIIAETLPDPAMSPSDLAKAQATNLVQNITSKSIVELTDMRDHLDDLMEALRKRERDLINAVEDHAALAADTIGMKEIVRESIEQLIARVAPAPVKTVTQRKGNGAA